MGWWWESLSSSLENIIIIKEQENTILSLESIKSYLALVDLDLDLEERIMAIPNNLLSFYSEDPQEQEKVLLPLACSICFGLGIMVGGRVRPLSRFRRITNLQDLPSSSIGPHAPYFRGKALKVSDGDTLRFYHVPTWLFHSSALPKKKNKGQKLTDLAWPVRVCTIDTPETAKFGKPGQAFGEEAKERLSLMLPSNKTIHVQVLTRDQYGRAVAQVRTGICWPFYKYVDQVMLQEGLAEVYRGSGAVYGNEGKDHYEQLEDKAKRKKKGMWSLGDKRESAADYKAKHK